MQSCPGKLNPGRLPGGAARTAAAVQTNADLDGALLWLHNMRIAIIY